MTEEDYRRLHDKLISTADGSRLGVYLNEDIMLDSVQKLNNSVMGHKPIAETMRNILTPASQTKIVAILDWFENYLIAKSNRINRSIEMIIPFQLASIAATAGSITFFVRDNFDNAYLLITGAIFFGLAIRLTLDRKKQSSDCENFRDSAQKTKSLRTALSDIDTTHRSFCTAKRCGIQNYGD